MNFHISNLSPLRPRWSSSSLSTTQPLSRPPSGHGPPTHPGPVRIAVEPADDSSSSVYSDTDDDLPSDISIDGNDENVVQDSHEVLVQRLTDLAARLGGADVHTACIQALHKQMDEMERTLTRGSNSGSTDRRRGSSSPRRTASSRPKSLQLPMAQNSGSETTISSHGRNSLGVMAPMSPSWLRSQFQRRPSVHQEEPTEKGNGKESGEETPPSKLEEAFTRDHWNTNKQAIERYQTQIERPSINRLASLDSSTASHRISSQVAEDAIKEAEKLCAEMATVIESLQTRREESDHLQTLLIEREAMAHQRLHDIALATGELENVVADNEAELRHLRLEMRALEVQCMSYVPKGADPKLEASIRNWKSDWHALREKWATRKGSSFMSEDD